MLLAPLSGVIPKLLERFKIFRSLNNWRRKSAVIFVSSWVEWVTMFESDPTHGDPPGVDSWDDTSTDPDFKDPRRCLTCKRSSLFIDSSDIDRFGDEHPEEEPVEGGPLETGSRSKQDLADCSSLRSVWLFS